MGFVSSLLGFCGFGVGVWGGIVVGYYLFIYFQPTDVKLQSHHGIKPDIRQKCNNLTCESEEDEVSQASMYPTFIFVAMVCDAIATRWIELSAPWRKRNPNLTPKVPASAQQL